ncbi:MAG: bifunctional 2-polyprenyl-6-hydroxyphenol methylase/3-demethylubiquinol 3-O-methyltransferase UbiG [Alphaproteobacteria bacterium]
MQNSATIDDNEINHFAKDSGKWWDENGPFKPLHRLNPVRMKYIKQQICTHFDRDVTALDALSDLNILDIGCGGGLASESLCRMGANVTGIDADTNAINTAKSHAKQSELDINYQNGDAANLDQKFDIVCALEIIEHVSDINAFIKICVSRLKPGGILIMSTLNRTNKSYALGIIAAEYILGWVPRGTHNWKKFVKPSEIAAYTRPHNLTPNNVTGLIFNPLKNNFELSNTDLDVNYLITLKHT